MKLRSLLAVCAAALALVPAVGRAGDSVGNAHPTPVYDPVPYVGSFSNLPVEVYLTVDGSEAKLTWAGLEVSLHLTGALACAGCVGEYGDGTGVADSNVDVTLIRYGDDKRALVHKLSLLPTPPQGDSVGNADDPRPWFLGDWGGQHIQLTLGAASGSYELDCAHGTIDGPFAAGSDGTYAATGTYFVEHGGPVRPDEPLEQHSTRYVWKLDAAGHMMLSMQWLDAPEEPFTFTLSPGQGQVMKCL